MKINADKKQIIDIKNAESIVEKHIQKPIDEYNLANGVKFANAHSCANYRDISGYAHQQFCIDAWTFNAATWEKARSIQTDVLTGTIQQPTREELIAMLPVFGA